jgi:hypothetical protein
MSDCEQNMWSSTVVWSLVVITILAVVVLVYNGLVYFGVIEQRTFPNVTTDRYISHANSEFDSNRTLMPKIEDFDGFKSNGYNIDSSVSYTNNKQTNRPYSRIASTSVDPNKILNSTILPDDRAVETVSSILPTNDMNNFDVNASLSGINGTAEASLRESMLNSTYELRKYRK